MSENVLYVLELLNEFTLKTKMIYLTDKFNFETIKYPESGKFAAIIERKDNHSIKTLLDIANQVKISSKFYENSRRETLKDLGIDVDALFAKSEMSDIEEISGSSCILCIPDYLPPYSVTLL
jgi:hypothetical protein